MANVPCFDCPDCGKEHVIVRHQRRRDPKRPDIFAVVACCFRSHDVTSDDIVLREKSEAEIASLGPVFSGSWVPSA
jgi:hypothetical protein